MQDAYVGDIGDYGKYGLLRKVNETNLRLAINWYRVVPLRVGKQEDGKYIHYLLQPDIYRNYDPKLFDELNRIVLKEKRRTIAGIEQSQLVYADFYSEAVSIDRSGWHQRALNDTKSADIVFLDPDNGLETYRMYQSNGAANKHVKWEELADYYRRGQSVILYQHRPQMTKKEVCIRQLLQFNNSYLRSYAIYILEFPKYTNRFYCFFTHKEHISSVEEVYSQMCLNWHGMCNGVDLSL